MFLYVRLRVFLTSPAKMEYTVIFEKILKATQNDSFCAKIMVFLQPAAEIALTLKRLKVEA